jgi:hypothetical protein
MTRSRRFVRVSLASLVLVGVWLAMACDESASCPKNACNPVSDGTPFDVLDWCQATGQCLRDGLLVPVCPHADASFPPSCALGPVKGNETLTFPFDMITSALGGRRDLVVIYAQCELDAAPAQFQDLQVLYDGMPAPNCATANPCDPTAPPTVMTCTGVPSTVDLVTVSFSYNDAEGKTALRVLMQNTSCSYFCS